VVAVAALLGDTDQAKLSAALAQITGGTPDYFEDEFTLIDLAPLPPADAAKIVWPELIALFKQHRLNPVAVRNAPAALEDAIRSHGLSIDGVEQSKPFELTPPPSPGAARARASGPGSARACTCHCSGRTDHAGDRYACACRTARVCARRRSGADGGCQSRR